MIDSLRSRFSFSEQKYKTEIKLLKSKLKKSRKLVSNFKLR